MGIFFLACYRMSAFYVIFQSMKQRWINFTFYINVFMSFCSWYLTWLFFFLKQKNYNLKAWNGKMYTEANAVSRIQLSYIQRNCNSVFHIIHVRLWLYEYLLKKNKEQEKENQDVHFPTNQKTHFLKFNCGISVSF